MTLLIAIAALVLLPFVALLLARGLDTVIEGMPRLEEIVRRLRRVRAWPLVLALTVMGLILAVASTDGEVAVGLAAVVLLVAFLRVWSHEFWTLMALRDEEFPGRFDKLIWAALLLLLAPLGVWLFRSYRLVHWPETEPVRTKVLEPEVV